MEVGVKSIRLYTHYPISPHLPWPSKRVMIRILPPVTPRVKAQVDDILCGKTQCLIILFYDDDVWRGERVLNPSNAELDFHLAFYKE